MDWFDPSEAHIINYTSDAGNMFHVPFYKMDFPRPARSKFITYAAGPGEEIKDDDLPEIDPVVEDVEKTFTGKISCRPGFETRRRSDSPSLVFSAYYSQFVTVKRLINLCSSSSLKT